MSNETWCGSWVAAVRRHRHAAAGSRRILLLEWTDDRKADVARELNDLTGEKTMENQFRDPNGQGTAAKNAEQGGEKAGNAKESVADFGRKAVESIDARRATAAV